jgi:hypothetical protein
MLPAKSVSHNSLASILALMNQQTSEQQNHHAQLISKMSAGSQMAKLSVSCSNFVLSQDQLSPIRNFTFYLSREFSCLGPFVFRFRNLIHPSAIKSVCCHTRYIEPDNKNVRRLTFSTYTTADFCYVIVHAVLNPYLYNSIFQPHVITLCLDMDRFVSRACLPLRTKCLDYLVSLNVQRLTAGYHYEFTEPELLCIGWQLPCDLHSDMSVSEPDPTPLIRLSDVWLVKNEISLDDYTVTPISVQSTSHHPRLYNASVCFDVYGFVCIDRSDIEQVQNIIVSERKTDMNPVWKTDVDPLWLLTKCNVQQWPHVIPLPVPPQLGKQIEICIEMKTDTGNLTYRLPPRLYRYCMATATTTVPTTTISVPASLPPIHYAVLIVDKSEIRYSASATHNSVAACPKRPVMQLYMILCYDGVPVRKSNRKFITLIKYITCNIPMADGDPDDFQTIFPLLFLQSPNQIYMVYHVIFHQPAPVLPYPPSYVSQPVDAFFGSFACYTAFDPRYMCNTSDQQQLVIEWDDRAVQKHFPDPTKLSLAIYYETYDMI